MAGGVGGGVVFNPHKRYFEVLVGIMGYMWVYMRLSAFKWAYMRVYRLTLAIYEGL